jgi:hypothetical protein
VLAFARTLHVDPIFIWLETSALSVWVRESPSVFAFPIILACHTIGMGFLAGMNAAIALRLLGFAPGVPLAAARRVFPVLWAGFWLNAISGVVLLVGYPTKALTNPVFYVKLLCVAIGLIVQTVIRRRLLEDEERDVPLWGKTFACASLLLWAAVIFSGRFLAYTYVKLTTT